jgi:hypothetical protein
MRTTFARWSVFAVALATLGTVFSAQAAEPASSAPKTLECRGPRAICENDKQCCSNRCILQVGGAYRCD